MADPEPAREPENGDKQEERRPSDRDDREDRDKHRDRSPDDRDRRRDRRDDRRDRDRRDDRRDRDRRDSRRDRRRYSDSRSRSPPRKRKSNFSDQPAAGGGGDQSAAVMMQQQMAAQSAQAMLMQQMMMAQQNNGGKKTRELYVGNLAIGMVTDQMLRDFFNTALAGLAPDAAGTQPAVINVWMSSDLKYSFVEFRTPELATTAIGLDKVELCGRAIHVGRPSGYIPPAGDGSQPGAGMPNPMQAMSMGAMSNPMAAMGMGMGMGLGAAAGPAPTKVLILQNMLSVDELKTDEYDEILADIKDECSNYGTVEEIQIPRPADDGSDVAGLGKAFIKFADSSSAQKANASLSGRTFDGKKVACDYMSEEKFSAREF